MRLRLSLVKPALLIALDGAGEDHVVAGVFEACGR